MPIVVPRIIRLAMFLLLRLFAVFIAIPMRDIIPRNASAADYLSARLRCNVTVAVALSRYLSGKLAVGAVLQHLPGRLVCHFCVLVYAAEYLGALPVSEITHG